MLRSALCKGRTVVGACILLGACAGCPSSGGLLDLVLSEEELAAYEEAAAQQQAIIDALPAIAVRIENNTSVTVRVFINAAIADGGFPYDDAFFGYEIVGTETYYTVVSDESVLVAAGGVATGEVRCAEVIAISASTPLRYQFPYSDLGDSGLYLSGGNVVFAGVGTDDLDSGFSGDVVSGVRIINTVNETVDCAASVLVISIDEPASNAAFDEESGDIIDDTRLGSGTVSIEAIE